MMFVSLIHSINSPIKTPVNRDKIVSLVINAKQIATRGGINVNKPVEDFCVKMFKDLMI